MLLFKRIFKTYKINPKTASFDIFINKSIKITEPQTIGPLTITHLKLQS